MNEWPAMDGISFMAGRSATEADVDNGAAVFVLKSDDSYIGSPLDIEVPQYAFHYIEDGGAEQVIVIQAEEAEGQKVVGAIGITSGQYLVGLLHEFELLGSDARLAVNKKLQPTADAPAE